MDSNIKTIKSTLKNKISHSITQSHNVACYHHHCQGSMLSLNDNVTSNSHRVDSVNKSQMNYFYLQKQFHRHLALSHFSRLVDISFSRSLSFSFKFKRKRLVINLSALNYHRHSSIVYFRSFSSYCDTTKMIPKWKNDFPLNYPACIGDKHFFAVMTVHHAACASALLHISSTFIFITQQRKHLMSILFAPIMNTITAASTS
jgi:hypothetical protein